MTRGQNYKVSFCLFIGLFIGEKAWKAKCLVMALIFWAFRVYFIL